MAAGKSITDILAGAKDTLSHAENLTSGVSKEADKSAPKPAAPAPKHEYSNAPYSLVSKPKSSDSSTLGKELSEKKRMIDTAKKGLPTGM
jgi:hypothetical protein